MRNYFARLPRGRRLAVIVAAFGVAYVLGEVIDAATGYGWVGWITVPVLVLVADFVSFQIAPPPRPLAIAELPDTRAEDGYRVTLVDVGPRRLATTAALSKRGYTLDLAAAIGRGEPPAPVVVATGLTELDADAWRRELEDAKAVVAIGPATA